MKAPGNGIKFPGNGVKSPRNGVKSPGNADPGNSRAYFASIKYNNLTGPISYFTVQKYLLVA